MNGTKILNRLIQVFVIINIVFLSMNGVRNVRAYVVGIEKIKGVTAILESKGIMVEAKLPRVFTPKKSGIIAMVEATSEWREDLVKKILGPSMGEIAISRENQGEGDLQARRVYSKGAMSLSFEGSDITYAASQIEKKEGLPSLGWAKRQCEAFIKKAGFAREFKNAHIEVIEKADHLEVIYYATFKGIPVFNSFMRFQVVGGGITEAFIRVAHIDINEDTEERRSIYPIHSVLFGLEDLLPSSTKDQRPLHITGVTLGYCTLGEKGMNILGEELIPVYKIIVDGLEEPLFVNAYTNETVK